MSGGILWRRNQVGRLPLSTHTSGTGAKLHSSMPVIPETFTCLDRNANRDVALAWKEATWHAKVFLASCATWSSLGNIFGGRIFPPSTPPASR